MIPTTEAIFFTSCSSHAYLKSRYVITTSQPGAFLKIAAQLNHAPKLDFLKKVSLEEAHVCELRSLTSSTCINVPINLTFTGKSDPFVTVKEGSEGGKEKFRTRTIVNTLDPVWNETANIAMLGTNGLLLLVRSRAVDSTSFPAPLFSVSFVVEDGGREERP